MMKKNVFFIVLMLLGIILPLVAQECCCVNEDCESFVDSAAAKVCTT